MKMINGAFLLLFAVPAVASPLYSGSVSGLFRDPVVSGQFIQADGTLSILWDNSTTAVYSGMGTNSIQWGACAEELCGDNGGAPRYSALSFTGLPFANVAPNEDFLLGTFSYTNGTSRASTHIFGVTAEINITLNGGGAVDQKETAVQLWSTANRPVTSPADTLWNADFMYFLSEDISFNVVEGAMASANIYGRIVGDPQLEISGLSTSDPNGYIGSGPSDYGLPEPATFALLGPGLAAIGYQRRKRAA